MRASRRARALARAAVVALMLGLVGACGKPHAEAGAGKAAALDPAVRGQALIDAGNQAFRTGDYRLAARRYAAAAVEKPDDAAAYYGLGMALAKLGRDEDARSAYARARELARRQQQP
ncbi:MAG TPA: tetratricopeptide repeat protein [Candidatus Udaeobacter sp.]|nr:tetratricopeptide repeat protein [Candidatus Udaeobacter sp.]